MLIWDQRMLKLFLRKWILILFHWIQYYSKLEWKKLSWTPKKSLTSQYIQFHAILGSEQMIPTTSKSHRSKKPSTILFMTKDEDLFHSLASVFNKHSVGMTKMQFSTNLWNPSGTWLLVEELSKVKLKCVQIR